MTCLADSEDSNAASSCSLDGECSPPGYQAPSQHELQCRHGPEQPDDDYDDADDELLYCVRECGKIFAMQWQLISRLHQHHGLIGILGM
eukprot:6751611-Pyramimonas_sp.AAC.1